MTYSVCAQLECVSNVKIRFVHFTRVDRKANIVVGLSKVPEGRQKSERVALIIIFSPDHINGHPGLICGYELIRSP